MQNIGEHHLDVRKRLYSSLQPFPHPDALKRSFDRIMYVIAFGVPLALVPQVFKVYAFKDVGDLAIETWALLAFFNVLWTFYGILHKTTPIIVSSMLTGALQVSLVVAILIYS